MAKFQMNGTDIKGYQSDFHGLACQAWYQMEELDRKDNSWGRVNDESQGTEVGM